MKLVRINNSEIAWQAMDSFDDRMISQTQAWTEFILKSQSGELVVAAVEEANQTVGYFTGVLVRRLGVPILGSPFVGWGTPYMGFNLLPGVSRREALRALERFAFTELGCLHVEVKDRRLTTEDGAALGFGWRMAPSYESDLTQSEDALFASFTSACRRCVRKAEKSGVTIEHAEPEGFAEEYYEQLVDVFAKQGLAPNYSLERVRHLIECLHPTGRLLLLRARNRDGVGIATGIFAGLNRHSFFIGNASFRPYQIDRPNEAMHWYALRYWKARGIHRHDWGGSGDYKMKYGVQPISVPRLYKSRLAVIQWGREAAWHAYYYPRAVKRRLTLALKKRADAA